MKFDLGFSNLEIEVASLPDVVLYTRSGCHLCDDAHRLLVRYGLAPRLVDIDADAALRERYNECVPVVVIDGKVRFRGRINEALLNRLLHYSPLGDEATVPPNSEASALASAGRKPTEANPPPPAANRHA